MFPPAITDEAENSQGCNGQINDPLVQGLGRPFTQLLRRPGTYGTLCLHTVCSRCQQKEQKDIQRKEPSHNYHIESQSYDIIQPVLCIPYFTSSAFMAV